VGRETLLSDCGSCCHTVAVVNDHAERAVALIQQFSGSLTKNEEQLKSRTANAIRKPSKEHCLARMKNVNN